MRFKIKNFAMTKFNNDVNHSGDLAQKFASWTSYRSRITDIIGQTAETLSTPHDHLLVLGAGACNDLDLHFLTDVYKKITLTDIDADSIREGIQRQDLSSAKQSQIAVREMDYTGLSGYGFFDHLAKLAQKQVPYAQLNHYICQTLEDEACHLTMPDIPHQYDAVLCCPIYTQLAYTQVEVLLKILYQYNAYESDELNQVITVTHHCMQYVIERFNQWMLSTVPEGAPIIMATDVAEIQIDHPDLAMLEQLLRNYSSPAQIERYIQSNGLDLGQWGRKGLSPHLQVHHQCYCIWPFNQDKSYLVYAVAGTKQSAKSTQI